jgi:hypothetical protein
MAVSYHPKYDGHGAESFRTWGDVAAWYDGLSEPRADPGEGIRKQVAALIDGVEDPVERIRAIGGHVQNLRYVALELGLSRYQPRSSEDVLASRYGDCKDKATLMKAMLAEAGLDAHLLLVEARPTGEVSSEFPSPLQFNHAIVAIPVPENNGLAPVVDDPDLGPLLLFDPTDEATPVGDLPWTDQGTRALLAHAESGRLLELPALPPEVNQARREWDMTLEGDGKANVRLAAEFTGQYARYMRSRYAGEGDGERRQRLLAFHADLPGLSLGSASFPDIEVPTNPARMEAEFRVEEMGRRAGPLRIMKPLRIIGTLIPDRPADHGGRSVLLPFELLETDHVSVRLPDGWAVPDLPADLVLEAPLGTFSQTWSRDEDHLTVERRLELRALEVPLEGYGAARSFFDDVHGALNASLIVEPE